MKITAQFTEKPTTEFIKFPNITKVEFSGKLSANQLYNPRKIIPRLQSTSSKKNLLEKQAQITDLKIIFQPNQGIMNIRSLKLMENTMYHTINKDHNQNRKYSSKKLEEFRPPSIMKNKKVQESLNNNVENVYKFFCKIWISTYGLWKNQTQKKDVSFKAMIEKGNNGYLIKQKIKARSEWNFINNYDSQEQINLIWTQYRNKQYISKPKLKNRKILTQKQTFQSESIKNLQKIEALSKLLFIQSSQTQQTFENKFSHLISKSNQTQLLEFYPKKIKLTNHISQNNCIINKKELFKNLQNYYTTNKRDPFEIIPLTFHINNIQDQEFTNFVMYAQTLSTKKLLWVIKPGQNTNRGNGISVQKGIIAVKDYLQKIKSKHTHIIQLYIKPYLYEERKFDIRCYMMVIMINKKRKGFWYEQGYIRTSSQKFNIKNLDKMIHLTNDAIQKYGPNYGKFEAGNKLSYHQLNKYMLDKSNKNFIKEIVPKMKKITRDVLDSVKQQLGGDRTEQSFQIYGLDFLIDEQLKPWLIEVNTNPCLQLSCALLSRIIPEMIENALKISVDPLFTSNMKWCQSLIKSNKFELIFEN